MRLFAWFRAGEAEAFGRELAGFLLAELEGDMKPLSTKATKKAQKVMARAARKVDEFRAAHRPNAYQKAKAANAFLWQLKEAKWPDELANQLTDWLTMRL
jgi:hypothetical protein